MKSIKDLEAIRQRTLDDINLRNDHRSIRVVVGMGTCGLVGQIGVYTGWVADVASGAKAGITAFDWAGLLLVSFVLPAVLCAVLGALFRKKGWIKDGDLKLD